MNVDRLTRTVGLYSVILLASSSCSRLGPQRKSDASEVESLAANESTHNIAILGSGAGPGVSSSDAFDLDVKKMAEVLRAEPFTFDVRLHGDKQPDELAKALASAAKELPPDGTLLFFFSGHGSRGNIYKGDAAMSYSDINAAVANGKYARFTAIIESCNSGSFTRGSTAIKTSSNFQSLLVMTAARADESSADDGTDSYFPRYLGKYLKELAKDPKATMGDLAKKVFAAAKAGNPGQSGDMNASPESILSELVHNPDTGPSQGSSIYVALEASTSDSQRIYASVPPAIAKVVTLCPGNVSICGSLAASDSRLIPMDFLNRIGDRPIYASKSQLPLSANAEHTILVFDAVTATRATKSQTVRYVPR